MKRHLIIALTASVTLAACEESAGLYAITGPTASATAAVFTGRWEGAFFDSGNPNAVAGVLQLNQAGANVSGTLTSGTRAANLAGTVSGTRLSATWTYQDLCGGSAGATADLAPSRTRMTGTYSATDCLGTHNGSFVLDRQP